MMPPSLSESTVESSAFAQFASFGYAPDEGRDLTDAHGTLALDRLGLAISRLNPNLAHDTIEQVVRTVQRPPHPTLIENNRWLHGLLTDGVDAVTDCNAVHAFASVKRMLVDGSDVVRYCNSV